jgi:hypothetical protein
MKLHLIAASNFLVLILLQVASAQNSGPRITSVTQIWPRSYQTIQISGNGFGSVRPYDGDSSYILVTDLTQNWAGGHTGDAVTLNVGTWSDSLIHQLSRWRLRIRQSIVRRRGYDFHKGLESTDRRRSCGGTSHSA